MLLLVSSSSSHVSLISPSSFSCCHSPLALFLTTYFLILIYLSLPCFPSASRLSFSVVVLLTQQPCSLHLTIILKREWFMGSRKHNGWRLNLNLMEVFSSVSFIFYSCCLFAVLLASYWCPWWKAHSPVKTKRKEK